MYKTARAVAAGILAAFILGSCISIQANEIYGPTSLINSTFSIDEELDADEVTARVARVSFVSGDTRIRRADSDEWESVTLNLPIVEGDEIVTEAGARIEIQIAKDQHLRLAENSTLKFAAYSDEGVAVSLSLGTMHLKLLTFDTQRSFFEIDAPKSTIAIRSAGSYRIDAGAVGDAQIRVAVIEGEARIYTENAGFTLNSGRQARLHIDGPYRGEWEAGNAIASLDGFDQWTTGRDETIALRLKASYYDKYYDDDIYGADDLNDNGQWIHTRDYGYVWRPHSSAIRSYADWSPYRYGHWRWMPPFGWTWVNDEPWGWATYHHGRWFYHDGYWNWSPYGYYRSTRSWWRPALVVITIVRNNICWYPLAYHQDRVNFNRPYHRRSNNGRPRNYAGPVPPIRNRESAAATRGTGGRLPLDRVPPIGVVGVDANDFGKRGREIRRMPRDVADTVIAAAPANQIPQLPTRETVGRNTGSEILAERPRRDLAAAQSRVGTIKRTADKPLDTELRTTRILGGRTIRERPVIEAARPEPQPTGIFERPAPVSRPRANRPVHSDSPAQTNPAQARPQSPPETARPRRERPVERETSVQEPPVETARPRREPAPAPVREAPRRADPPAAERPPRTNPPAKEAPKSSPAPVRESPKPARRPDTPSKRADPVS